MTRLRLAARSGHAVDRMAGHLRQHAVADLGARAGERLGALELPVRHPLIGHPVGDGLRERVIAKGSHAHVAYYRHDAVTGEVRVAALRSQREGGLGG